MASNCEGKSGDHDGDGMSRVTISHEWLAESICRNKSEQVGV